MNLGNDNPGRSNPPATSDGVSLHYARVTVGDRHRKRLWVLIASIATIIAIVAIVVAVSRSSSSPRKWYPIDCVYELGGFYSALLGYDHTHKRLPDNLEQINVARAPQYGLEHAPQDVPGLCCPVTNRPYVYYRGLNIHDDPGHWILAHEQAGCGDDGSVAVLYLSGEMIRIDKDLFLQKLGEFTTEFQESRGYPPLSLETAIPDTDSRSTSNTNQDDWKP